MHRTRAAPRAIGYAGAESKPRGLEDCGYRLLLFYWPDGCDTCACTVNTICVPPSKCTLLPFDTITDAGRLLTGSSFKVIPRMPIAPRLLVSSRADATPLGAGTSPVGGAFALGGPIRALPIGEFCVVPVFAGLGVGSESIGPWVPDGPASA